MLVCLGYFFLLLQPVLGGLRGPDAKPLPTAGSLAPLAPLKEKTANPLTPPAFKAGPAVPTLLNGTLIGALETNVMNWLLGVFSAETLRNSCAVTLHAWTEDDF